MLTPNIRDLQDLTIVVVVAFTLFIPEYLCKNRRREGGQVIDQIISDIRPLMEDWYEINVNGHR